MRQHTALVLVLGLIGCASSTTTAPATASSAASAAPVRKESAKPRKIALVEADGPTVELESFVARFASEASDKGISVVDARLGGGRLAPLATEPGGAAAKAFQEQWPSDAYLAVTVTLPEGKSRGTMMTEIDPYTGRRVERMIGSSTAETDVALRLVDARDGHVISLFDVKGVASVQGGGETGDPGKESVLDAAERAAKKLLKIVK